MTHNPPPDQSHQWAQTEERGSYWGMRFVVWLYRHGGHLLLHPVVWMVVAYFFVTRSSTRRYSRLYLQRAIGGRVNLWQLWLHHLAFARALLDRIGAWMGRLRRSQVMFQGSREALMQRGSVILGSHLGNLEMCRALVEKEGALTLNVILHSANTEKFNRLLSEVSDQVNVRLIQVADISPLTAIRLRGMLDNGESLILLADRLPPGNDARFFESEFLGDPARFPAGPFWLALMLGAPVYFMAGLRTPQGLWATLEPLYDGAPVPRKDRDAVCRKLVAAYAEKLAQLCRAHPYQWFNFYDFWRDDDRREQDGQPTAVP